MSDDTAHDHLIGWAIGIISNVDAPEEAWPHQSDEWREAARKWLDEVHSHDQEPLTGAGLPRRATNDLEQPTSDSFHAPACVVCGEYHGPEQPHGRLKPMRCPVCGTNFGSQDEGAVSDDAKPTPLWYCSQECYAATWRSRSLPSHDQEQP